MNKFTLARLLAFTILFSTTAYAECVVPADARGSFAGRGSETLCEFGTESEYTSAMGAPVRGPGGRDWDRLISPSEEFSILKRLAVRNRTGNEGILRSAVNGGTTPNSRASRRMPTVRK